MKKIHNINSENGNVISKRFESDCRIMVKYLSAIDPISIIIYGGYGRGEGAWIIESPSQCRPYNDYDILVIARRMIPKKNIKRISDKIRKEIGIRWIDLGIITISQMKVLKPSIYNYDLKNASSIIYGNLEVLENIPSMDRCTLPMKEVETLYFTRLWTLLGSLEERGLSVPLEGEDARFFRNQMAKSILAVVDIKLLLVGDYHPSYKKRVEVFKTHFAELRELHKLADWALAEKIRPQSYSMTSAEVNELYDQVLTIYINEMYKALSIYYKRKVETPAHIEKHLKWSFMNLVKRIGWILIKKNRVREKMISLRIAQSYLVAAHNSGSNLYLHKGIKALKNLNPDLNANISWDEARILAANLRLK
jgi:hypothetical protein